MSKNNRLIRKCIRINYIRRHLAFDKFREEYVKILSAVIIAHKTSVYERSIMIEDEFFKRGLHKTFKNIK